MNDELTTQERELVDAVGRIHKDMSVDWIAAEMDGEIVFASNGADHFSTMRDAGKKLIRDADELSG